MKLPSSPIAIIEGIDGSGKSTVAQFAAEQLSEMYPSRSIGVTDSTGFFLFQGGEIVAHEFNTIEKLSVDNSHSKIDALARLGAFTIARKALDYRGMARSDFLLSVRDAHRIDPATYAAVYAGPLGRLSTVRRLGFFDRISHSPRADAIVHLQASPEAAETSLAGVEGPTAPHVTRAKLEAVAAELPIVLNAYKKLFGCSIEEVPALEHSTVEQTVQFLEVFASK